MLQPPNPNPLTKMQLLTFPLVMNILGELESLMQQLLIRNMLLQDLDTTMQDLCQIQPMEAHGQEMQTTQTVGWCAKNIVLLLDVCGHYTE